MKTNLILSALVLGTLAVASSASATQINGSGANFHAYNASEATLIDYLTSGVRSLASYQTYVIASLDHNPSASGQGFYIDGYHSTTEQSTTCTVYSYNFTGALLGSASVTVSSLSGAWDRYVALTAEQSPQWAYYSVLCSIPGNGQGILYGAVAM